MSRRTGIVLAVAAVVTALAAVGLSRLNFATGQDSYLDRDTKTAADNRRYQELFGGETMVVLFTAKDGVSVDKLFAADNLAKLQKLEAALKTDEAKKVAVDVVSPLTVLQWDQNLVTSGAATQILGDTVKRETDPAKQKLRADDSQLTLARALGAGKQDFSNADWVKFLTYGNQGFSLGAGNKVTAPADDQLQVRKALVGFIPDRSHAMVGVVLAGNASLDQLADGNKLVTEAVKQVGAFDGFDVTVTGTPTFLTEINDYLQGGMLTLGLFAIAVMTLVLGLTFGVKWRFLPLGVVVAGTVWGFGAFGFTGIDLSLVTISGLPILIGIGIDFAIQVHNRAEEELAHDTDGQPFARTTQRIGPPLLAATLAAIVAFLVMLVSKVPMIRDFGILLSIGIVALVVAGMALPITLLGWRQRHRPSTKALGSGPIERFVVWLGSLPRKAVVPLIVLAVALPVVGLLLEHRATIESDPINWANQSSAAVKNARKLEDQTRFATTLGMFVENKASASDSVFTDKMAAFVDGLQRGALADEKATLVQGSSLVSAVSDLTDVPGTTPLAPTAVDLRRALAVAPDDVKRLLVSSDGNALQIAFRVAPSSLEDRAALVKRLEQRAANPPNGAAAQPTGTTATPAGLARVGVALFENLTDNRSAFTYLALVLVAGFLALWFRNLVRALLTMVPILLATGLAALVVALLNITLSPLTTVGAPLIIALCAEFSILITSRYVEERERGLAPREAVDRASGRTGRAFTASALATIGGFGVLMFSSLPLLRDFGAVVTLKVVIALLAALVVMPPLAIWADERGLLGIAVPAEAAEGAARPVKVPVGASIGAGIALVALGIGLAWGATGGAEAAAPVARFAGDGGAPVAIPTTTTTTAPPTTTAAPGQATAPTTTLPPGPAEKPAGLVAGTLYDALVGVGANPGQARCTTDTLVKGTPEADLLAKGIANQPPSTESIALVAKAATACGVPQTVQDALVKATGATPPPTTAAAAPAAPTTLPPGPAEKPAGLVAGAVYDGLVSAGADPGQARCTADELLKGTSEADLLAKGIANRPPPAEVTALVRRVATACGIPAGVQDTLLKALGG